MQLLVKDHLLEDGVQVSPKPRSRIPVVDTCLGAPLHGLNARGEDTFTLSCRKEPGSLIKGDHHQIEAGAYCRFHITTNNLAGVGTVNPKLAY